MWESYTVAVVRHTPKELAERMHAVGDLIQRRRVQKDMSQDQLGKALHLSRKTVGLIEQGKRPLDQWEMDVLSHVLDIRERSFYDPPKARQLVSEPLEAYLAEYVGEAATEAATTDRRRRERRKP